jgi:prepilin peptidase CpaA
MHSVVVIAAVGVLVIVAYRDVRLRRIPNALCLAIGIIGLIRIISARDALAASYTFLAAAVTFTLTFLLFWRGAIGGGDAKLITAMALLVGHRDLFGFLFLMSLFGGVLALAACARDNLHSRRAEAQFGGRRLPAVAGAPAAARPTIPYGVAIAVAGVIILITMS